MKNFRVLFCNKNAQLVILNARANDAKECAKNIRRFLMMSNPTANLLWSVYPSSRSIELCMEEFGKYVFSKTGKEISPYDEI